MRNTPILILLLVAGCSSNATTTGKGTDSPKSVALEPPTLDEHVALARKAVAQGYQHTLGRLPRGLGPHNEMESFQPIASGANRHFRGLISALHYRGVEGDQLCFIYGGLLAGAPQKPVAEVLPMVQQFLTSGGIWLEAIESLDELAGRAAWPPGPASVRLSSIEVLEQPDLESGFGFGRGSSSENGSREGKDENAGRPPAHADGSEAAQDEEIFWDIKLCAPRPAVTSESRYLVALSHAAPSDADSTYDPELDVGDDYKDTIRFQHDTLLIWVLGDDGAIDLSR